MSAETWPWAAMLVLGAVHGLNPGMGWLFAVALGLQEGSGRAVWRALPPLAIGHAAAVAAAVLVAAALGRVLPLDLLKWLVGGALLALGGYRLVRHRHPRWRGMRVNRRDLAIWSFLMASAHGAGLMVLPFTMAAGGAHGHGAHAHPGGHAETITQAGAGVVELSGLAATAIHTAAYLLITGVLAVIVYEKFGLRFLRSAWINLDVIWAGALVVTALTTLLL